MTGYAKGTRRTAQTSAADRAALLALAAHYDALGMRGLADDYRASAAR